MIGLKDTFGTVGLEDWVNRLKKDLKSDDLHELHFFDEIEEIDFISYHHASNTPLSKLIPGDFPYTRQFNRQSNAWKNTFRIDVRNVQQANTKALEVLMKGADALIFDLKDTVDYQTLLNGIGMEHIHSTFLVNQPSQIQELMTGPVKMAPNHVSIGVDPVLFPETLESHYISQLKDHQIPFYLISGYPIQQCGGTIVQEIAFMLSSANECMFKLINTGMTADEAAACIHFRIGIGSNYFMQIAKIRAMRTLWAFIVQQYGPIHNCSYNCRITASIGAMNKSAKDPHTNLLRQTTEALSAVSGGVDQLHVEPHDSFTKKGSSALAERMALNISLILQEESYLDKVIDPSGGSYTVEQLTRSISEKAWGLFGSIDSKGGILQTEVQKEFMENVRQKGLQRISAIKESKNTLIGINKYPNPAATENNFLPANTYLGTPEIILERDI